LIELQAYSTLPAKEIYKSAAKYLLFTSPSNAEAYLNAHELANDQVLVAIGPTTAEAIRLTSSHVVLTAPEPTERAIWETILEFERKA
jgi:uroporphyrinogen-III synthase